MSIQFPIVLADAFIESAIKQLQARRSLNKNLVQRSPGKALDILVQKVKDIYKGTYKEDLDESVDISFIQQQLGRHFQVSLDVPAMSSPRTTNDVVIAEPVSFPVTLATAFIGSAIKQLQVRRSLNKNLVQRSPGKSLDILVQKIKDIYKGTYKKDLDESVDTSFIQQRLEAFFDLAPVSGLAPTPPTAPIPNQTPETSTVTPANNPIKQSNQPLFLQRVEAFIVQDSAKLIEMGASLISQDQAERSRRTSAAENRGAAETAKAEAKAGAKADQTSPAASDATVALGSAAPAISGASPIASGTTLHPAGLYSPGTVSTLIEKAAGLSFYSIYYGWYACSVVSNATTAITAYMGSLMSESETSQGGQTYNVTSTTNITTPHYFFGRPLSAVSVPLPDSVPSSRGAKSGESVTVKAKGGSDGGDAGSGAGAETPSSTASGSVKPAPTSTAPLDAAGAPRPRVSDSSVKVCSDAVGTEPSGAVLPATPANADSMEPGASSALTCHDPSHLSRPAEHFARAFGEGAGVDHGSAGASASHLASPDPRTPLSRHQTRASASVAVPESKHLTEARDRVARASEALEAANGVAMVPGSDKKARKSREARRDAIEAAEREAKAARKALEVVEAGFAAEPVAVHALKLDEPDIAGARAPREPHWVRDAIDAAHAGLAARPSAGDADVAVSELSPPSLPGAPTADPRPHGAKLPAPSVPVLKAPVGSDAKSAAAGAGLSTHAAPAAPSMHAAPAARSSFVGAISIQVRYGAAVGAYTFRTGVESFPAALYFAQEIIAPALPVNASSTLQRAVNHAAKKRAMIGGVEWVVGGHLMPNLAIGALSGSWSGVGQAILDSSRFAASYELDKRSNEQLHVQMIRNDLAINLNNSTADVQCGQPMVLSGLAGLTSGALYFGPVGTVVTAAVQSGITGLQCSDPNLLNAEQPFGITPYIVGGIVLVITFCGAAPAAAATVAAVPALAPAVTLTVSSTAALTVSITKAMAALGAAFKLASTAVTTVSMADQLSKLLISYSPRLKAMDGELTVWAEDIAERCEKNEQCTKVKGAIRDGVELAFAKAGEAYTWCAVNEKCASAMRITGSAVKLPFAVAHVVVGLASRSATKAYTWCQENEQCAGGLALGAAGVTWAQESAVACWREAVTHLDNAYKGIWNEHGFGLAYWNGVTGWAVAAAMSCSPLASAISSATLMFIGGLYSNQCEEQGVEAVPYVAVGVSSITLAGVIWNPVAMLVGGAIAWRVVEAHLSTPLLSNVPQLAKDADSFVVSSVNDAADCDYRGAFASAWTSIRNSTFGASWFESAVYGDFNSELLSLKNMTSTEALDYFAVAYKTFCCTQNTSEAIRDCIASAPKNSTELCALVRRDIDVVEVDEDDNFYFNRPAFEHINIRCINGSADVPPFDDSVVNKSVSVQMVGECVVES